MIVVLAGKSNALIEAINEALKHISVSDLRVLPSNSDTDKDGWQYSVKKFCKSSGIQLITLEETYELSEMILISIQYDRILRPNRFKSQNLFNIHYSYLPYYKGMYPAIWPILNHEEYSGVTLHYIDAGIDTGDIIDQQKIYLDETTNARSLYFNCQVVAVDIFKKNFRRLLNGKGIRRIVQPNMQGSYFSKDSLNMSSLQINLNKTANEIAAQIRAISFREYQMPVLFDRSIVSVHILEEKSQAKAGSLLEETGEYLKIAAVDYNLLLKIDYLPTLFNYCYDGDIQGVKKIIHFIDNLEEKNEKGWTPLMTAAFNEKFDIVKFLVEKGADVNAVNYKGTTVLMYAKSTASLSGDLKIVKYLLSKGAEIDVKDNYGKFLIEYAMDENNISVIELLLSASSFTKKVRKY